MKRVFIYLILLLLAIAAAVFAQRNADSVSVDLYLLVAEAPLVLFLYLALAIGAVAGVLLSLTTALIARREAARLRKRLSVCEQEIKNLREIPIKGHY